KVSGDTLLILMNAHQEPVQFVLPAIEWGRDWEILVDTSSTDGAVHARATAGGTLTVVDRGLMVLRRAAHGDGAAAAPK
ncbi:MAG TPA: hypothetical protein VGF83_01865, partial [Actinomycetota bacterium]